MILKCDSITWPLDLECQVQQASALMRHGLLKLELCKGLAYMENNRTDVGVLVQLYVPGCTGLTAEGIVKIVKMLTEHNQYLKSLRLHGLYGITKEHVETLHSCLKVQQEQQKQPSLFLEYRRLFPFLHGDSTRAIDVEICPKCNDVRLVFDCPRESCKRKRERPLTECKACYHCIPRCEECGGCVESEELGETVCTDFLCSDCWLRLPKCNLCNKPYCNRHADQRWCPPDSTGFICSVCHVSSIRNLAGRSSELEEDMIEDDQLIRMKQ